ncbi:phosphoinositide phospholipase C 4-like isoform X2 [Camellia sinensis]|uniref:phosphoinositide phospholipase C 4-like isoform X2 n=1 Tax=Camellia sinensis TaxID=4442 RepID=UPI0010365E95|nr:phosphoinositide phospholipase C 4-like isoform X2 [Camellia sinensis]XP_028125433.1 phosphoinositide phospholipase C 4-like isoform X2 [Camellia sinensis]
MEMGSELSKTDDIDQDDEGNDDCEQKSCQLGARQYKHPIAIHAGKPKNGLKEALRAGIGKIKRLSLCETTLEKATKSYGIDLVRFTQKNILRVYPKWTRVTSSNFNPLTGWMHEAQMVAFNLQVRMRCFLQGNSVDGFSGSKSFLIMSCGVYVGICEAKGLRCNERDSICVTKQ